MPIYVFKNKRSGRRKEIFMSLSERETYLKEHPEMVQELTASAIVSGIGTVRSRTDSGFRDVLKNIKKKHRGSTIDV